MSVAWPTGVKLDDVFLLLQIFGDVVRGPGLCIAGQLIVSVSPRFSFILVVIMIYLFVLDDSLTS